MAGDRWLANGAHREEDLLGLLDHALVLPAIHLRRRRSGPRETLHRRLQLVQRPLLALPHLGRWRRRLLIVAAGFLLERAAAEERRAVAPLRNDLRRAAEAPVDGEVDDRGGHGGELPPQEIRILRSSFCYCVCAPFSVGIVSFLNLWRGVCPPLYQ